MSIDFHTHIFPATFRDRREEYAGRDATFAELFGSPDAKMATAEELVAAMDQDGVDVSVVMGVGWTDHHVAREANDYIIESVDRYPGRLKGFGGVNPAWGEIAVAEAERCAKAGLLGIGELHPDTQGFDLGDRETMDPLMELVSSLRLMVTTHASEPVGHIYQGKGTVRPEVLWRFIQNYPDATIVCAHWGGGLPFYALMPEVSKGLRNVYFDTAASTFLYTAGVFSVVASLAGAERILLASDFPLLRVNRLTAQLDGSALSAKQRQAIVVGNAARLLRWQVPSP